MSATIHQKSTAEAALAKIGFELRWYIPMYTNLVTFPICKSEMAMANLTRISFPLVESQTFQTKTGAT